MKSNEYLYETIEISERQHTSVKLYEHRSGPTKLDEHNFVVQFVRVITSNELNKTHDVLKVLTHCQLVLSTNRNNNKGPQHVSLPIPLPQLV